MELVNAETLFRNYIAVFRLCVSTRTPKLESLVLALGGCSSSSANKIPSVKSCYTTQIILETLFEGKTKLHSAALSVLYLINNNNTCWILCYIVFPKG